jgi:hypothetical protein
MDGPLEEDIQDLALEALDLLVNRDTNDAGQTAHDVYIDLIDRFGADGLKVGLNLWLANATHELGGFMPGEMVTVEFSDGTAMSEMEKRDPAGAWAARMLLAYLSQNEDLLATLLGQLPKHDVIEWSWSLLELCAVNIRAKVIDGEDISPKTQYIEIEDA